MDDSSTGGCTSSMKQSAYKKMKMSVIAFRDYKFYAASFNNNITTCMYSTAPPGHTHCEIASNRNKKAIVWTLTSSVRGAKHSKLQRGNSRCAAMRYKNVNNNTQSNMILDSDEELQQQQQQHQCQQRHPAPAQAPGDRMDSGTELFLRQEMGTNNNPALPPAGPAHKKKWSAPTITLASPGAALGSVDEYSTEVNYDRRESSDSRSGGSRRGSTASGLGIGMGLLFASRRPSRDSSSRRGSESAASIASVSSSGRRDSTPGPGGVLPGLDALPQGLDDKGAKGRRRSWHVAKLERKRRKGVISPTALSDSEAPKPREKRPSWWNIFASDKTRLATFVMAHRIKRPVVCHTAKANVTRYCAIRELFSIKCGSSQGMMELDE
ncbi:hypothetical protein FOCC_FOCC003985 [Frankliniella occidentalis]|nr:hypothetical protein FOCC_FOCC003985 [Frankliniella occidentalis]